MKIAIPLCSALLLCACATTMTHRTGITTPSFETTYREGVRQVTNVGDFMTSTSMFAVRPGFVLPTSVEGQITHRGNDWRFTAPAGTYSLAGRSPEGDFYLSREGLRSNTGPHHTAYGGVFVPAGSNTIGSIVFHWVQWSLLGSKFSLHQAEIAHPVPLPEMRETYEPVSAGVLQTLSYAGVSGGQIKFAYKEFTEEGLARPAFTQEVAFDYVPGETYGYKNARFVVHEAGNTQITFTLISHL